MWGAGGAEQRSVWRRGRLGAGPAALPLAFATSVAVIFPLCLLSAGISRWRGGLEVGTALPYLLGGALGGWLGGRWFKGVRMDWLRRVFGLLLLYGGLRCLL